MPRMSRGGVNTSSVSVRTERRARQRPAEALAYNGLVQGHPDTSRLAGTERTEQAARFEGTTQPWPS